MITFPVAPCVTVIFFAPFLAKNEPPPLRSQLLDFFGHEDWGKKLIDAIETIMVEAKVLTPDMNGKASTSEVGDEIVRLLG